MRPLWILAAWAGWWAMAYAPGPIEPRLGRRAAWAMLASWAGLPPHAWAVRFGCWAAGHAPRLGHHAPVRLGYGCLRAPLGQSDWRRPVQFVEQFLS